MSQLSLASLAMAACTCLYALMEIGGADRTCVNFLAYIANEDQSQQNAGSHGFSHAVRPCCVE